MRSGFTLIELLIAISVVAVISAVGYASFQGVQAKARDSTRKSDLKQLSTALELYYQKNGQYIDNSPAAEDTCTGGLDTTLFYNQSTGIAQFMASQKVPADPSTSQNYCYISVNNGQAYRLFAKLENCSDPQVINSGSCATDQYNYSVTSADLQIAYAPGDGPTPTPTITPTSTITPTPTPTSTSAPTPTPTPTATPTPSPTPTPTPTPVSKRVFVTSTTSTGSLGGLSGADNKCKTLADASTEPGVAGKTWMAWLSITGSDPASRFTTKNNGPYVRIDGAPVADNWTKLTNGTLFTNPINVTETNVLLGNPWVWTNTNSNGTVFGSPSCNSWSNISGSTQAGRASSTDSIWTSSASQTCSTSTNRLYCFEQ